MMSDLLYGSTLLLYEFSPVFEGAYFPVDMAAQFDGQALSDVSCRGTHKHPLLQTTAKDRSFPRVENSNLFGNKDVEVSRIMDSGSYMNKR